MNLTRTQLTEYTQQVLTAFTGLTSVSWKRMGRIVTSDKYLMTLGVMEVIYWEGSQYNRGVKWPDEQDMTLKMLVRKLSKRISISGRKYARSGN